jgi:hypothetical protein
MLGVEKQMAKVAGLEVSAVLFGREKERETDDSRGYLVNPIWPPLGSLPHSCDSKAERDVKPLGRLLATV